MGLGSEIRTLTLELVRETLSREKFTSRVHVGAVREVAQTTNSP